MDIIKLLAGEQRSLLHARFGAPSTRSAHAAEAIGFGAKLLKTNYPHCDVVEIATDRAASTARGARA